MTLDKNRERRDFSDTKCSDKKFYGGNFRKFVLHNSPRFISASRTVYFLFVNFQNKPTKFHTLKKGFEYVIVLAISFGLLTGNELLLDI